MTENWVPVAGWADTHEVSNLGRVRSLPRSYLVVRHGREVEVKVAGRVLSAALCNGYPRVPLKVGPKYEYAYVHRLVCLAFHGEAPVGCEVAHNDGERTNAAATNLRWDTRAGNLADTNKHGTDHRGEKCWIAKLDDEAVRDIRRRVKTQSQRSLAREYGVTQSAVWSIIAGRTWSHVA